ncbi:MAG: mechanosensitive ion channel family protein, partial [Acidimicrobiales bacterium]
VPARPSPRRPSAGRPAEAPAVVAIGQGLASRIDSWGRTNGLEIVLIAVGSILLARFVHWLARRAIAGVERSVRTRVDRGEMPSEGEKHMHAVAQATEWAAVSVIYFVAFILVLLRFGVPLTTLVAPATVVGVALGFGAQRVVQDLLAGFFLFSERQFGVGDVIRVSQPGSTTGTGGTVEELTLRVTKLRTLAGELVTLPNSELRQVTNLSKGWAQVVVDIPVSLNEDVGKALGVLRDVAATLPGDPEWEPYLLDAPEVTGVESIQVGYLVLRVVARTPPGQQWGIGRELRQRAVLALRQAGIVTPTLPPNVAAGTAVPQ